MTDTITLPREVVEEVLEALEFAERHNGGDDCYADSITALRTALAAPRLEVTVDPRLTAEEAAAISAALAAPKQEPVRCNPADYCAARHMNLYTAPPEDEALRRDAERYRWLRERAWFQFEFDGRYGDSGETVQELDAAIDAAMKEGKR